MSNATQHSHQSGDSRRRRSRGGKNRNQQENRRGGDRGEHRGTREDREDRGPARSEEFRPQVPRPPRGSRPPVKLSWWQKLLKAIGLYKEPARPERPERKPEAPRPQGEARPAKSNVRNARSSEGESAARTGERPPRRERGERGERGGRGGERSRGGDGSTVESPRVYVGNLSYDVTEQDLQELFKGIGGVRNVEVVYNRSTHRSKGYGFVEMLHMDEAVRAVEVLHDQPFMGRKLTVSGAKSKGQDEREEAEDRPERESRTVSLAPLPAAAAVVAETAPESVEEEEPVIQTIVETVIVETSVEEETPVVGDAAPQEAAAVAESEPKSEDA
ncbi:MAG: hypothetical protein Q8Q59_15595 [Luteolibacter sp.]|jgi:hypothetical protein|nr:hypothetical protein [Luteolibacter sp.]